MSARVAFKEVFMESQVHMGKPFNMGEPWSAVTPNKAKENTSAFSHFIHLLAAFSVFHI